MLERKSNLWANIVFKRGFDLEFLNDLLWKQKDKKKTSLQVKLIPTAHNRSEKRRLRLHPHPLRPAFDCFTAPEGKGPLLIVEGFEYVHVCLCALETLDWALSCALWLSCCWPLPTSHHSLGKSSHQLPLKSKHDVDHLQAAGDLLQDAVVLPKLV